MKRLLNLLLSSTLLVSASALAGQDVPDNVQVITVDDRMTQLEWSPDLSVAAVYPNRQLRMDEPLDNYLWLVDGVTGEEIARMNTPTDYAVDVAFSPAGDVMASAHANGNLYFWDVTSGEELRHFSYPFISMRDIQYISDTTLLITYGNDITTQIIYFDTENGTVEKIFSRPIVRFIDTLNAISSDALARLNYIYLRTRFSPNDQHILAVTPNDEILSWDTATGELESLRPAAEAEARGRFTLVSVRMSADGTRLIYANGDNDNVELMALPSGDITILPVEAELVMLSADNSEVYWINRDTHTVYAAPIDDLENRRELLVLTDNFAFNSSLSELRLSGDGQTLLLTSIMDMENDQMTSYRISLSE